MGIQKTLTNWNSRQEPVQDAFWGPVTASINWCEADYDVSRYVAEFINTLSNIPFLCMAGFGLWSSRRNGIPAWLQLPLVGVGMIGTGSFLFHATLSYHMQLLDELPMLWTATFATYCVFSTHAPGGKPPIPYIGPILFTIVFSVCAAYIVYPDPVLHQAAFACILASSVFRATYLCRNHLLETPFERQRNREVVVSQWKGVGFIVLAFAIWLVDCFACDYLTSLKRLVGKPLAFVFELHAWWHLGTGLGGYWLSTSLQLLILSIMEDPHNISLEYAAGGWLPYVCRKIGPGKASTHGNGNATRKQR